jgi:hypothetical protein
LGCGWLDRFGALALIFQGLLETVGASMVHGFAESARSGRCQLMGGSFDHKANRCSRLRPNSGAVRPCLPTRVTQPANHWGLQKMDEFYICTVTIWHSAPCFLFALGKPLEVNTLPQMKACSPQSIIPICFRDSSSVWDLARARRRPDALCGRRLHRRCHALLPARPLEPGEGLGGRARARCS